MDRLAEWLWGVGSNPPPIVLKKSRCLVVGPAPTVWEDLRKVDYRDFAHVRGVNSAGICCPHIRFDSMATLHPEIARGLALQYIETVGRSISYLPIVHSKEAAEGVDVVWEFASIKATSGLFAVKTALAEGYEVVLAGVPFDRSGYQFWPPEAEIPSYMRYGASEKDRMAWQTLAELCDGRVKSLSGWTAEIFGGI